jgi:hypothetical protein
MGLSLSDSACGWIVILVGIGSGALQTLLYYNGYTDDPVYHRDYLTDE